MAVRVVVVTGPPAGGKSTYIRDNARRGDVVVDLDRLALALTSEDTPHHEYARHITTVAVAARRAAIDAALSLPVQCQVWIVDTQPTPSALARYREAGADLVACDPGQDVVLTRVRAERPAAIEEQAKRYYSGRLRTPKHTSSLSW